MDIDTGIAPIGRVTRGSHFCRFFKMPDDLSETLVPYFKTGLECEIDVPAAAILATRSEGGHAGH
jgi:hypothetical protein